MGFCIEVSGGFACFTRPEMKVERVSYDIITPSAARNIYQAILWKPAIDWRILKIEVLKPIRWFNLKRNEVSNVIKPGPCRTAMKKGRGSLGIYVEEERQQRSGLLLRDVAYRIHADFVLTSKAGPQDSAPKFAEMFRRRAKKGQCFNQPYLGTREFSCHFRLVDDMEQEPAPIPVSRELGWMLYDMDFTDPADPRLLSFYAEMKQGVVAVPDRYSDEVKK